jgi:hypothetical protein
MPYITDKQKKLDPNWYDHLKPSDTFHSENPIKCGVCSCESDFYEVVRWIVVTKLHLVCPGSKVNRELHDKIDRKKDLYYEGTLPGSLQQELRREIIQMKKDIQMQVAAVMQASASASTALKMHEQESAHRTQVALKDYR